MSPIDTRPQPPGKRASSGLPRIIVHENPIELGPREALPAPLTGAAEASRSGALLPAQSDPLGLWAEQWTRLPATPPAPESRSQEWLTLPIFHNAPLGAANDVVPLPRAMDYDTEQDLIGPRLRLPAELEEFISRNPRK